MAEKRGQNTILQALEGSAQKKHGGLYLRTPSVPVQRVGPLGLGHAGVPLCRSCTASGCSRCRGCVPPSSPCIQSSSGSRESKISDPVYWGLQLQAANALLTGVLVECFPRTEESCPVEGTLCDRRNGGYLALKLRKPSNPRLPPPHPRHTQLGQSDTL